MCWRIVIFSVLFFHLEITYAPFALAAAALSNAVSPESIPTYPAVDEECVHPDVVYFADGWNGYKYWMAFTPYPSGDSAFENPSIVVSNDGSTWVNPSGISNPVVAAPGGSDFNADPDLVYNSATDELWLYYVTTNTPLRYISRKTSTDGINWSAATIVLTTTGTARALSPAIVYNGSSYFMYTIDTKSPQAVPYNIDLRTSSDGLTWSSPQRVVAPTSSYSPWHINVDYVGGEYRLILNAFPNSSDSGNGDLFFGTSADGITFTTYSNQMISGSDGNWDHGIYRSCAVYVGSNIEVWYSGLTSDDTNWNIGYKTAVYATFLTNLGTAITSATTGITGRGSNLDGVSYIVQ